MEPLNAIRELTFASMLTRIAVSIVLGAILGVERGLKNRPAGLRTYILVCMGACIIMLTNQYVYMAYNTGDPVRMAAQVVSGIGFLGAGSIIVTKQNQIRGLTTAAGLWAVHGPEGSLFWGRLEYLAGWAASPGSGDADLRAESVRGQTADGGGLYRRRYASEAEQLYRCN